MYRVMVLGGEITWPADRWQTRQIYPLFKGLMRLDLTLGLHNDVYSASNKQADRKSVV